MRRAVQASSEVSSLERNPENREAPNKSELKPVVKPNVANGVGYVAIKGAAGKK
jgi:hypothetical protein